MESEIIPMCEDQGMAISSWASLGGGQLTTKEQREKLKNDADAGHGFYEASEDDIKVCEVLEDLANQKSATLQDIVSHSDLSFANTVTDFSPGSGIPVPSIHLCLPYRRRADRGARQAHAQRT